jgi:ABC-type uncharacterized transport system substrate-binding protein
MKTLQHAEFSWVLMCSTYFECSFGSDGFSSALYKYLLNLTGTRNKEMFMKVFSKTCLMLCVLSLAVLAGKAMAAKKVVVVSGVTASTAARVGTYTPVYEGIKEGLKTQQIEPEFQYVELDTLENDEAKASAGIEAIAKIRAAKPDLVISLDDNCLKFVGSKIDEIPVVFAWIWGQPEAMGLPKANITGVTRRSYAADILTMARKLTGVKTVALLSKSSASMAGVKQYLTVGADKLEQASGIKFLDMYLLDTFAEWENKVQTFPADLIYLADTTRIEKEGVAMNDAELVRWTVENAKVPVIAGSEKDIQAGALFAIVTSEKGIGLNAAEIALKILGGAKPADIPYVSSATGKLVINAKTAQKYKLNIPYDILASAGKIYE